MLKTIKIFQQGDRWMSYQADIKLLLPTPFSPRSRSIDEVIEKIQRLNPDCIVSAGSW